MCAAVSKQNIALGSVTAITVGAAIYVNNRMNELESRITQIEKHLASIIPRVDPNIATHLKQCVSGIRTLEEQIQQLKVQNLDGTEIKVKEPESIPIESDSIVLKPERRRYVRITRSPAKNPVSDDNIDEDDADILEALEAVKAM
jgi:hypothetical protein